MTRVTIAKGDGIGPEIMDAARKIMLVQVSVYTKRSCCYPERADYTVHATCIGPQH
jgi:isocitrate/isopropylmalate dehydrogenase